MPVKKCTLDIDEQVVILTLEGLSGQAVARKLKVDRITVYRRLKDPLVRDAIRDGKAEILKAATHRLAHNLALGSDGLVKLLKARSDTVKLGAIRTLFEYALKCDEAVIVAERLDELEKKLKESGVLPA